MGIASRAVSFLLILQMGFGLPSAWAAVNKEKKPGQDIQTIEKQLKQHSQMMGKIREQLQQYETALTTNNQQYLQVIEGRKNLEGKMDQLSLHLSESEKTLKQRMQRANDALNGVVLTAIEEQNDASTLLSRKMLGMALKRRLVELKLALAENQNIQRELGELNTRYANLQQNEKQLAEVLGQLEADKRVVVQNYETVSKREDEIKTNYHKLKATQYRKKVQVAEKKTNDLGVTFFPPIAEFSDLNYKKKKGVSFYFKKIQPVTAPGAGKIVFKGTVGSFGQILFIDHGNDVRSVILGHFAPKVEKEMMVNKGDVLGYTEQMGNKIGEIYYEVRQKNIALNTITLLDKSAIAVR